MNCEEEHKDGLMGLLRPHERVIVTAPSSLPQNCA